MINSTTGTLRGTINNTGVISLLSAANNTDLIAGDVTLTGGGTVTMSNSSANRILGPAGTRLTTNNLITGAGQIGVNVMKITNTGLIVASSSGTITIDPEAGADGVVNSGTLRADSGALRLAGGTYTNRRARSKP